MMQLSLINEIQLFLYLISIEFKYFQTTIIGNTSAIILKKMKKREKISIVSQTLQIIISGRQATMIESTIHFQTNTSNRKHQTLAQITANICSLLIPLMGNHTKHNTLSGFTTLSNTYWLNRHLSHALAPANRKGVIVNSQ